MGDRFVWGKIIGGVAGFAIGGPVGAIAGVALGHAADSGGVGRIGIAGRNAAAGLFAPSGPSGRTSPFAAPKALGREQVFAIGVVVISAKLAKCDGPVNRAEIDEFKRHFRVPATAARDVGRLFDQARESPESADGYALHMGEAFSDNLGVLDDVLAALFTIARADKPLNGAEQAFLEGIWRNFGLGQDSWARAIGRTRPTRAVPTPATTPPATAPPARPLAWQPYPRPTPAPRHPPPSNPAPIRAPPPSAPQPADVQAPAKSAPSRGRRSAPILLRYRIN